MHIQEYIIIIQKGEFLARIDLVDQNLMTEDVGSLMGALLKYPEVAKNIEIIDLEGNYDLEEIDGGGIQFDSLLVLGLASTGIRAKESVIGFAEDVSMRFGDDHLSKVDRLMDSDFVNMEGYINAHNAFRNSSRTLYGNQCWRTCS